MKIKFIAHASVLIETEDCTILTDPWYKGTAFNDSWKLFPEPVWDNSLFDRVDHLWISHEHPDHFNIATLKALPQSFKDRAILLFQKNNSDKMPNAFRNLGFKNIQLLNNRKTYSITAKTKVYVNQIGQMDSCLGVMTAGCTLLNLNDCEANTADCRQIRKDIGKVDVLLNQFSMAGYNGYFDYDAKLPAIAKKILETTVENHKDLGARTTIPFASNIYFCTEDNKYINDYANTPATVNDYFLKAGLSCTVLYPGDTLDTNQLEQHLNKTALETYNDLYTNGVRNIDTPPVVELNKIEDALIKRSLQLKEKFPAWLLKKLRPVTIHIRDLKQTVRLSLFTAEFTVLPAGSDFDLEIYAQPLFFSLSTLWGVQTMGVGARFRIKNNVNTWKWYRIITSLNNAEMYLKTRHLFTMNNYNFVRSRMKGGINQLLYQLKRMS